MDDKYRGAPLRTTPEARERADKTLRNIYGTRVKIPPPGSERDQLIAKLHRGTMRMLVASGYACVPTLTAVEYVLRALEEELS